MNYKVVVVLVVTFTFTVVLVVVEVVGTKVAAGLKVVSVVFGCY